MLTLLILSQQGELFPAGMFSLAAMPALGDGMMQAKGSCPLLLLGSYNQVSSSTGLLTWTPELPHSCFCLWTVGYSLNFAGGQRLGLLYCCFDWTISVLKGPLQWLAFHEHSQETQIFSFMMPTSSQASLLPVFPLVPLHTPTIEPYL